MAATAAKSATGKPNPASRPTPDRRRFALASPSRAIDHSLNAARRDLADIALAGQWFAPHYAVPQSRVCASDGTDLRTAPDHRSDTLGPLPVGDRFAVLELGPNWSWGYREADRCVGYIATASLGRIDL